MSESTPQPDGASEQTTSPGLQPPYVPPVAPAQPQYGEVAPYAQQQYPQQPYGQQPYPQQPVGQQPYGQNAYPQAYPQSYAPAAYAPYGPPQPRGLSITSMVLGLVSILFWFTFVVPAGAIVLGIIGLKKEPAGRGMAITGIILGGVCLLGVIIVVALWITIAVAALGTAGVIGTTSGYAS